MHCFKRTFERQVVVVHARATPLSGFGQISLAQTVLVAAVA